MPKNNETKNFHARRKCVDKEVMRLGNRLNELRQKEKSIPSQQNRDEISKLERENVEKMMVLLRMDGAWKREKMRREKCSVKSELCPLSPIREACQ